MPPGPTYNLLCVAYSVARILSNVAEIRAAQLARTAGAQGSQAAHLKRRPAIKEDVNVEEVVTQKKQAGVEEEQSRETGIPRYEAPTPPKVTSWEDKRTLRLEYIPETATSMQHGIPTSTPSQAPTTPEQLDTPSPVPSSQKISEHVTTQSLSEDASVLTRIPDPSPTSFVKPEPTSRVPPASEEVMAEVRVPSRKLQSSKVPSSRIGRLFHYGGLAASMGYGAAAELLRRTTVSDDDHSQGSLMMSEGNIKRLVSKLTKMRGAALKLGQFMSIQDTHVLPPEVESIFRRVQDSAHYMPDWQMEQVMRTSLGPDWATKFSSFERVPFAAASIGQVHAAVLAAHVSPTGKDEPVAVKVQFPNIRESIESDLGYVKLLLTAGRILPRGLFLDRTLQVMKGELADECNYVREASYLRRFRSHLESDTNFYVPWVWDGSTDQVLVMERVNGVSVGGAVIEGLSQDDRNAIAERIIDLCLRELFVFRVMQTDPNWTNFLWNGRTHRVELVDFGATREYSKEFIDNWLHLLQAAATDDKEACIDWSLKVGYLTGAEDQVMLDAHAKSMTLLATPFKASTLQPFSFGPGSSWAGITAEIRDQIPVMLQHRLTPPPRETYSLNRKLSGAFLLAARLNARVDCKKLWDGVVKDYQFSA